MPETVVNKNIPAFSRQLLTSPTYFLFKAKQIDFDSYENFSTA